MPKHSHETVSLLFYSPIVGMIVGGGDRLAQNAACKCLSMWIQHIAINKQYPLLAYLYPKFVLLFMVSNSYTHSMYIYIYRRRA